MQLEKLYMSEDWYVYLVEECRAIITERVKKSRLELIMGYAEIGERIFKDDNYHKYAKNNQVFLKRLFSDIGINKTDGYACVKFYATYLKDKDVSMGVESLTFEEGDNISWNKIKTRYLIDDPREKLPEDSFIVCPNCNFKFKP